MTGGAEVWLSCGYAVFLLGVAFVLDRAARRVSARSIAWHSEGFHYHPDHDAWQCPKDQWLWPHSFDPDHRVVRYRGSPLVCNACPVKHACTSSSSGREISRNVDPWPSSEAERFHRGIACAVAVIAVLWPLAVAVTRQDLLEAAVCTLAGLAVALGSWPLWSHLRRTPAGFPEHLPVRSLDPDDAGERPKRRPPRGTARAWTSTGREPASSPWRSVRDAASDESQSR